MSTTLLPELSPIDTPVTATGSLWHAFADMSKVPQTRVVLERG